MLLRNLYKKISKNLIGTLNCTYYQIQYKIFEIGIIIFNYKKNIWIVGIIR
jgi:hypothetical protein